MPAGYVIIKHQVFSEISDEEVLKLLPLTSGVPRYEIFSVKREIIGMELVSTLDNTEYRIYQKNFIDTKIKPFLASHPDWEVLYFGTATIPLALHFGYCFGAWKDVQVFLLHRENSSWEWKQTDPLPALSTDENFVKESFSGSIDVIYKVEVTYKTHEDEIQESVEGPTKTISLGLSTIEKDAFDSMEQMKQFAYQFSLGIDSIANNLPNAEKIHLFPTVPVGLAFLMGTRINPNITKPIVTYQYNTNNSPKYERVLVLQELLQHEENISENDQKFISEVRAAFKNELENNIQAFARNKAEEKTNRGKEPTWSEMVLPSGNSVHFEAGYWKNVPHITATGLTLATLLDDFPNATEGFYLSEDEEWEVSDRFIFNISKRLDNNKSKILRALRMFVFHEALHVKQNLTSYTANGIGRFPRILEEVDYMADVWAMIHEYSFSLVYFSAETKDVKEFFKDMIMTAISTMWAFDDLDPNYEEMQVRRVNRYLIWYWLYLLIEDRECKDLNDILRTLSVKPLVELKGLNIHAIGQRTVFKFTNYKQEELEIGYLAPSTKIVRDSNSSGLRISEVIKGFKERNGNKILDQLKAFRHQNR